MPVTGWLITLTADVAARRQALQAMAADPRLKLGERQAGYVAVVATTADPAEDEAVFQALTSTRGVAAADLVFADFSDVQHCTLPRWGRLGRTPVATNDVEMAR